MPTSDKELAQKQAEIVKLREQIAAAEADRTARERELSNDVVVNALEKEADSLRAQLSALKESAKVSNVKAGAAAVLDPDKTSQTQEDAKLAAMAEADNLPAGVVDDEKGK